MAKPKYSKFDLSHERKLSLKMGDLVPIYMEEILPGDKFRVKSELLLRVAPMLAPVMHRVNVTTHFWSVPLRLVWNEFEDFITGGRNGDLKPVHPHMGFPSASAPDRSVNGSLADYLGLPTFATGTVITNQAKVSALAFRAYQLIYNEWYRDPNLTDPVPFSLGSGPVAGADFLEITKLRKSSWEKDYFTSALPWAQRGSPVGAPVDYPGGVPSTLHNAATGALLASQTGIPTNASGQLAPQPANVVGRIETEANVMINDFRKAHAVQRWLERMARGGARYIEQILAHFGVRSSDSRLQRPEFLGGTRTPIVISEVLSNFQLSSDPAGLPQGNMAGHGIAAGGYNGFSRRFEEHCIVIGIMRVLPRTAYQQGIHRKWQRFDKFDFAWPAFAHLGEQEVKQSELYWDPTIPQVNNDTFVTFGYQERYADYKYGQSTVHGEFRDSLSYWTMGRIFSAAPVLNEAFVTADPTTRIFAVQDPGVDTLYCQCYHRVDAIRPLPFFGVPD